jgi:C-terminal processing protease CtpA/Prc
MSGGGHKSNVFQKKHWSVKAHESLIRRNAEGNFCLNIEGGAENGLMPFIGEIRQERVHYQSGKLAPGEILLEINSKRVVGMIKKDVIALIKRSADPVSLVTVKPNATITRDLRQYLGFRFTKNSVDSELQHQIRENLHMRVVPCTTRNALDGEREGVDYNFISVESFQKMEKNGELLESGTYQGNFYGTPRPPANPQAPTGPTYSRSDPASGYSKEGLIKPQDSSPTHVSPFHSAAASFPPVSQNPKTLGSLPSNWEIAYTENNEKYFIDHNSGSTHWLDPRLSHLMKRSPLECNENEMPYGWEKVNDPVYGTYYINHVNRTTQYENPVTEAKRKHAGAQLPNRQNPPMYDHRGPPPMRAPPPSFQSAAAMEKQLEAEAAARWPEAGFGGDEVDMGYYPYPYAAPPPNTAEQDLEAELKGDTLTVTLLKTMSGFGFTIIGGDRAGELLQIKSIVRGSVAERDGRLLVGDVLVRINGISVLSYSHKKVVELFQSIPLDSDVQIEVRRGYPLPGGEELPPYVPDSGGRRYNDPLPVPAQFQSPPPPPQPEKLMVNIVKGPLGFGFSLGEGPMGPVVKQIMDHPRCAQLREGDIILEVNGEKVRTYMHTDLVTVLKRCQKGNQATFTLLRQPQEYDEYNGQDHHTHYLGPDGYPGPSNHTANEPFTTQEIRLMRQVSGFGFRIIGGKEEGSQATVGAIVPGGAADVDGRLQVGDEITHISGHSVIDAPHHNVISAMGEAAAQGEVVLNIRRKMPMPESLPPSQGLLEPPPNEELPPPPGVRDVRIDRPNMQTSFGFVLQSNTLRPGCMICRLVAGSPAESCQQLYVSDELLAVNHHDVSHMDHSDIVSLIKNSGVSIHLTVQQPEPEELEFQERQQMMNDQQDSGYPMDGGHSWENHQGLENSSYPPQQPYAINDSRREYQDYPHGPSPEGQRQPEGFDEEVGPQITADIDSDEDEEIHHIDIRRDGHGFGFSIRGGAEYSAPLCVLRMAGEGAAERDGRLRVGDELLEINGNSTEGMLHSDAITIIKHGGDVVKLIVRRVADENNTNVPPGSKTYKQDQVPEGQPSSPKGASARDRYPQEYVNRARGGYR